MIDWVLIVEQTLNGVQLGVMLFLMAAGLTLTFGIMNLINLAHGSLYMLGAYFAVSIIGRTGSIWLAVLGSLIGAIAVGALIEVATLRRLYNRSHLDQVLATFGLTLFFNELARLLWGNEALVLLTPNWLSGHIELLPEVVYPVYRFAITVVGLAAGLALYVVINHTRMGMLIRAGASNREMVGALGINIKLLYTMVFGLGAALAALAGVMTAPILSVQVGIGEPVLILAFVVVVIGGIGSVRGAFVAALIVGIVDTFCRFLLPLMLGPTQGSGLASMAIYILMAGILILRPQGLMPSRNA